MILNLIPAKLPDGCHDFLLIKFALTRPFSSRFKIFRALVSSGGVGLVLPFFFSEIDSHRIHVMYGIFTYIYLHLVDVYGKCR